MEKKLDPEFKARWIAALRSGKYKQGESNLFKDGKYCCIGVAGSLRGIPDDEMENESDMMMPIYFKCLPELSPQQRRYLADMNDGSKGHEYHPELKKNFNEISDYIKQNL